ncbi:hypothetical protein SAMN05660199_04089 [Klenkia soli]|uniref:AMIN-like domain-containing protein n=1 Tax=Klenkia soli TaxID=1052260 RepID=A0A1H0TCK4_9ACTN|nr:hypothetical protein [Klenkia soli]SDP51739.1 hypothetical protein SAMN05660199_04089 [Klenkia soli]
MRRPRPAHVLAVVPVCALVLVAGCGERAAQTEAATPATTTATSSTVVSEETTDAPPFPADTALDTADAVLGEGPTVVTGIRAGTQDGFARVVFDISGTTVPGWYVTYVDAPVDDANGALFDVPGSAFLQVSIRPVANPYMDPGVAEAATGGIPAETGPVVGLFYASVYEGQALAYVGLTAERPFRVFSLTDPTRIVVDVQD